MPDTNQGIEMKKVFVILFSVMALMSSIFAQNSDVPERRIVSLTAHVTGLITLPPLRVSVVNTQEYRIGGANCAGCNGALSNRSALVLIDGVEGDLNSIRPEDVHSFSVLKDPASVAMYGTRGVNGVVLVTTNAAWNAQMEEIIKSGSEVETDKFYERLALWIIAQPNNVVETDTAIAEPENPFPDLKVYPNPFSGTLHLTGANGGTLRIIAEDGAVVHTKKLTSAEETLQLGHLRVGVYFFHVDDGKQTKVVKGVKTN